MQNPSRIHRSNLINSGILPLTFADPSDYDRIDSGDALLIEHPVEQIQAGNRMIVHNVTKNLDIVTEMPLSDRLKKVMLAGGLLNETRKKV